MTYVVVRASYFRMDCANTQDYLVLMLCCQATHSNKMVKQNKTFYPETTRKIQFFGIMTINTDQNKSFCNIFFCTTKKDDSNNFRKYLKLRALFLLKLDNYDIWQIFPIKCSKLAKYVSNIERFFFIL